MSTLLPILVEGSPAFDATLKKLENRGTGDLEAVAPAVREILADVRANGDAAVRKFVERFERRSPEVFVRTEFDGEAALARLDPAVATGLKIAAERIERYHRRQWEAEFGEHAGFYYQDEDGVGLGLRVRPIRRVGVYAPGGKARYPSSVLMTAIPAKVAGVRDIVLATPAPDDSLLAAAHLAGVNAILDAGGAHAIGALAYGTESLRRVDKIVGPGNAYVACAKRLVFGDVAIDSIAGPSEILVLADDQADPALVAAELLSQAEHDQAAYAVLVTTSEGLAQRAAAEVDKQLAVLERKAIAEPSIQANGVALVVRSEERLVELAELIAAEHVAFYLARADEVFRKVDSVGAALITSASPVAVGDYFAGPSHVLPTGGCVRFGSPLGVHDFVARSSVIRYTDDALRKHGPHIARLARAEGLTAHARSIEMRLDALPSRDGGSTADR